MTDSTQPSRPTSGRKTIGEAMKSSLKSRYAAEKRFQAYGIIAIALGLIFLGLLFYSIISRGYTAFEQTIIDLPVDLSRAEFSVDDQITDEAIAKANYSKIVRESIVKTVGADLSNRGEVRKVLELVSREASNQIRNFVAENPDAIGSTQIIPVLARGDVDSLMKGQIKRDVDESRRQLDDQQLVWIDQLIEEGRLEKRFNTFIFTEGPSSRAESSGIAVAVMGSAFMMGVVLLLALPIGVAASIYLEEFAPKNRWTDLIEVNINNLAAVPSIVYGILGLAVFINYAGLPRSSAIVGGLVLTLMTLPTIIIATRAALRAVPPSIREAALGVGASKNQAVFHHVLPLAAPGVMTGTIIGLAQALGETAPLLMIGMVAFVNDFPTSPWSPATAVPVQIFLWANSAERAFVERTSAAIIILLVFLICMNALAVFLRRRFEQRW
ncbi:MAG: phosphate ABC transporter permease PstA [Alphaproteobacteria bacterium]